MEFMINRNNHASNIYVNRMHPKCNLCYQRISTHDPSSCIICNQWIHKKCVRKYCQKIGIGKKLLKVSNEILLNISKYCSGDLSNN